MLPYLALTRMAVQRSFAYRLAAFAGLATNFFFGLLRASVMIALFTAHPIESGMNVQDAVTYTGLTQAVIGFLALFSWFDIVHSINNGQIGTDLLKPVSFFGFWIAQDAGRAAVNLLLRGAPIMVFFAFFYRLTYPTSIGQWIAVAVSLALAWLVSFSFRFLVNLAAFWSPNAVGFCRLFFALSWILSGFFMPLRFFPQWFLRLCYLTPFPQMVATPADIYLGLLDSNEIASALLLQGLWCVALIVLGNFVLSIGIRRLVIQGG